MDLKGYESKYRHAPSSYPRRADWRLRAADAGPWILVAILAAMVIGPICEWAAR